MKGKIIIIIDQSGRIEVQTKGIKGTGCMQASKFVEEALGQTLETRKTSDFYAEEQRENVKISRGE